MFTFLTKAIGGLFIGLSSIFGVHQSFGNTSPAGTIPAVFETYLASQQSTSDTTMTLASGSLRDGTSLSGYVCFTVDSGSNTLEYECGTVSGTSVTGILRGIDATTGTTTVSSLIFSHRRGADVKITDYPSLTIATNQLNGTQNIPNPISYQGTPTFTSNSQLASVGYVTSQVLGTLPVIVPSGGTGNTSNPLNMLLVGNGTSAITSTSSPTVGYITATSSTATSLFNGNVTVNATSTLNSAVIATTTITTANIASTTIGTAHIGTIYGNGANITNISIPRYTFSTSTKYQLAGTGWATSTSLTIPAGVFTASSTIQIKFQADGCLDSAGTNQCQLYVRNSAGNTFTSGEINEDSNVFTGDPAQGEINIYFNSSLSSQNIFGYSNSADETSPTSFLVSTFNNTSSIDLSNGLTLCLVIHNTNGTGTANIRSYSVVVNP